MKDDYLNMRSLKLQWALIPCDWCPCKKRKFRHTDTNDARREGRPLRTQQGGDHLQATERGPRGNQACPRLALGLLASRPVREKFLSVVLCYGHPSKLTQYPEKNENLHLRRLVGKCL